MAKKIISFEEKLDLLKEVTKQLESGQMPLDDSLKLFEKGIALYRECATYLEEAERKVTQLIENQETLLSDVEGNS